MRLEILVAPQVRKCSKKKIKNDQSMSTGHRSHVKEFPLPKLEQFEQRSKVVIYDPKYEIISVSSY